MLNRQKTKDKRPNLPAIRKRSSSFPPTADPLLRPLDSGQAVLLACGESNGLASQRRASDDLVAERQAGTKDRGEEIRSTQSLRSSVFGLRSHQRGLALAFAIFVTVGMEILIAGNLLQAMRQTREISRTVSDGRLSAAADSVIDRSLRLFRDYILTSDHFPSTVSVAGVDKVIGDDLALTGQQSFSNFLSDWFENEYKSQFVSDTHTRLNEISVYPADINITEIEQGPGDNWRRYNIAATVHSQTASTHKEIAQEVKISRGQLFNFSVFSNEIMEITPGPNFTMQGPIFSNKDIYLFNNQTTTKFTKAKNFANAANPEPYVLNSAGNIYFGFRSEPAPNYYMSTPWYKNQADTYLQNSPQYIQVNPNLPIAWAGEPNPTYPYAPYLYTFSNGAECGWGATNVIQAEDAGGSFVTLSHVNVMFMANEIPYLGRSRLYYGNYATSGKMSYGGVVHPHIYPQLAAGWTMSHPDSSSPLVNPNWISGSSVSTVKDRSHGVITRNIPIGDPTNPSGPHLLIEPLTSIFPPVSLGAGQYFNPTRATVNDTAEVIEQKFQNRADLNIYITQTPTMSPDFKELMDLGVIKGSYAGNTPSGLAQVYDYRLGQLLNVIQIDMAKLLQEKSTLLDKTGGVLMYVHVYGIGRGYSGSLGPHAVQIINGQKLPKNGLTIATNGRLFIQGDYNTFSYDVCPSVDNPSCYCTHSNNLANWDNENCHTPTDKSTAAVFSDSLVVLSNEWINPYGRSGQTSTSATLDRPVTTDVMVNTAIATGFLESQLTNRYPLTPVTEWHLRGGADDGFQCSDTSWQLGKDGVSANCESYQDLVTGIDFVNKRSTSFLTAVANGLNVPAGVEIPWNALYTAEFKESLANYQVLKPVRAVPGLKLLYTNAHVLFGRSFGQTCVCNSTLPVPCPGGIDGDPCIGRLCIHHGGGEATSYNYCGSWTCAEPTVCSGSATWNFDRQPRPAMFAWDGGIELYNPYQSGGIENLINLQEKWTGKTLRVSGTFAAPWLSRELHKDGNPYNKALSPAFWATTYYEAPERRFDFNEDVQTNPPPGTPGIFTIERQSIKK